MLSLKALSGGDAGRYYLQSLPDGPAAYYLDGRPDAWWLGAGADQLGLAGRVHAGHFEQVLAGRHPATGQPLISGASARAGRVAGYDLTFAAPKSVSILAGLADQAVAHQIRHAHGQAVADTIAGIVEPDMARVRRGAGGHRRIPAAIVAASFEHHVSRGLDPHLHSHVVVANLGVDGDGRWTGLFGSRLFGWAKTAGFAYQAALRHHLTQSLAVEWGPVVNGVAEIGGVSRTQLEAFSSRAAEIRAELDRTGTHTGAAAQVAAWRTRPPKPHLDDAALDDRWHRLAADVALDPAAVTFRVASPRELSSIGLVDGLVGADGLTANRSVFDRRDILQGVAAGHRHGVSIDGLRGLASRLEADPRVVALGQPSNLADTRYSTRDLLAIEAAVLRRATDHLPDEAATVPAKALTKALGERPTLSAEQQTMVEQVVAGRSAVTVVVGRAGAGKTFALDAARAAWQNAGVPVVGAALAARAAAELQAGAGIPSTTLDRLLADTEQSGSLAGAPYRGVVVVDEAGMVGTRKLARLLAAAEQRQAKVILVGDPRQLPEIEAGGALAALTRVAPTVELADNRRQSEPWEREALAELRAGQVTVAVAALDDHRRITLAPDAHTARDQLVADWWQARQDGHDAAMYALRRADVDDLNQRARQHMQQAGLLHGEPLTTAGRDFAVGDHVLALRNDRRLGLRNGTHGTVTAVDHGARSLRIDTADGERTVPAEYLDAGRLDHGYATTVHKAQGATVDRAFVLGSDQLYREAGYVALSRARQRTDLYLVAGVTSREPIEQLNRQLDQSRAQQLASDSGMGVDGGQPQPGTPARTSAQPSPSAAAALADPPGYLVDLLGPPPPNGLTRDRWANAADAVIDYRHRWHITDRTALGLTPEQPDQARHRDRVQHTVDDLARHQDRARHLDQGMEI